MMKVFTKKIYNSPDHLGIEEDDNKSMNFFDALREFPKQTNVNRLCKPNN